MSGDTEWKTIRVPKDVYQDAKERKKEHGVTWGEYVNPHAWHSVFDAPTDAPSGMIVEDDVVDREELAEDRQEQLEEVVYSACGDTATEESIRELRKRIDDLETNLPAKVAQEVRKG